MRQREKTVLLLGLAAGAVVLLAKVPAASVDAVDRIAEAIAKAEGFFVPGSRPARNHNPGNLTADVGSTNAIGRDGSFTVYATDEDGWEDLRHQVRLMLNGGSRIYRPTDTILEVARNYTTDEPRGAQMAWASIVADQLGVSIDTRLEEIA